MSDLLTHGADRDFTDVTLVRIPTRDLIDVALVSEDTDEDDEDNEDAEDKGEYGDEDDADANYRTNQSDWNGQQ